MPFIAVVGEPLRSEAIKLAVAAEAKGASTWDIAFRYGFFAALRLLLPSETVGFLLMDCDMAIEDAEGASEISEPNDVPAPAR